MGISEAISYGMRELEITPYSVGWVFFAVLISEGVRLYLSLKILEK
tara:strand:- start:4 stop:141 length:138 start_codon:yes stop_codon:yes gene_type:complete